MDFLHLKVIVGMIVAMEPALKDVVRKKLSVLVQTFPFPMKPVLITIISKIECFVISKVATEKMHLFVNWKEQKQLKY